MSEWQPIETAPRDGTPVLLFVPDDREPDMVTGRIQSGGRWWTLIQTGGYAEDSDVNGDPSHWMPLPSPPS